MTSNGDGKSQTGPAELKDFEKLTRPHVDSLWRSALRITGCRATADDLTQEACLKAFRSLDQYQEGSNYRAWIFRILVNLCTDYQRRESRSPFTGWDNSEVEIALSKNHDKGSLPDVNLEQSVFYAQAIEAMSKLRPDVRLVVCLSLLDGMSYQEIAEVTDVPIGTVRSRLSRGRKKLQDELKRHFSGDSDSSVHANSSRANSVTTCDSAKKNNMTLVSVNQIQKT